MQNIINLQSYLAAHQTLFISLVVWSIIWKGFALWKAGESKNVIWFVVILFVNTFGLLEIIYLFAIKNKEDEEKVSEPEVKTEIKTEEKVEEKKEEVSAPIAEVKHEETNQSEVKVAEPVITEEVKTEEIKTINQ